MELDARGGEITLNMDGEKGKKTRERKKVNLKVNLNVERSSCVSYSSRNRFVRIIRTIGLNWTKLFPFL